MRFAIPAVFVGVFIRTSIGGTLQIIDDSRECKIYSNDNHGCTGYSAPFAKLNGDDCSNMSLVVKGTRIELPFIDIAACGQVNGKNVAWIQVDRNGEVTFSNQNGDKAKCQLDNGLKTGSSCTASEAESLASTSTTPSSSASVTSTPSSSPTASSSSDTGSVMSTCACA